MSRSYGTLTLRIRAIGSKHFVGLDFSPVYNARHEKKSRRLVTFFLFHH